MAYPISSHSLKMKFPEFQNVPSAMIEFAIEEASLYVDSTWGIYETLGFYYRSAHILMTALMRAASGTGQQIESESFAGVLSVTYAALPTPTEAAHDDLEMSSYGLRYKELVSLVFPAVAII